MNNSISDYHPILHTLILGGLYYFGVKFGRTQMGIDWYCLFQMVTMSGMFAYSLYYLKRRGVKKWIITSLLLFYLIYPLNSILTISATKDSIFSTLVLLWLILYHHIFNTDERLKKSEYVKIYIAFCFNAIFQK